MNRPILKITATITLILLTSAAGALAFGTGSGNTAQRYAVNPAAASKPQEISFVPPTITIDGIILDPGLVMSQLKLNCLSSAILHGEVIFDEWSPDHCPEVVNQMIGRELLAREAVKKGIKVTDEEFEPIFKRSLEGLGGLEGVQEFFSPLGLTIDDFRSLSRHTYLARKYTEQVLTPGKITDTEREQYYEDNIDILSGTEMLTYSYVGVRFMGETDEDLVKRMKADARKVATTADVRQLAALYGHELGRKGVVAQVYENEVNSLEGGVVYERSAGIKPGSATFFTNTKDNGEIFHIILLVETFSPRKGPTYEQVKPDLKDRMMREQTSNAIKSKVQELMDAAAIKVIQE